MIVATSLLATSLAGLVSCSPEPKREERPSTNLSAAADPLQQMRAAMAERDWPRAEQHATHALLLHPDDPDVITDVARVTALCERRRDAAKLLIEAAVKADFQPPSRVTFAVQALIDVGELYDAIELLERTLQRHPERTQLRRMLVGFLGEAQRTERIPPHLTRLIRDRAFDAKLLVATTETSSRRLSSRTAQRLMDRNPDDQRIRLLEAFVLLYRRDAEGAAEVLQAILEAHPDFAPAHAMYGQALAARQQWNEIPTWIRTGPAESANYADHWLALGDWCQTSGQPASAVRCFWEATRRDPNQIAAWNRLASAIRHWQREDSEHEHDISEAQLAMIARRASRLEGFRERFNQFTARQGVSQRGATEVAARLLELGRTWEAEAWSAVATTLKEETSADLPPLRTKILARLQQDPGWVAKDLPALAIDLSDFPQPDIPDSGVPLARPASSALVKPAIAATDHLRMTDESEAWGLSGIGAGNNPADARLAALIRSTGVGGGTIDYDLDGWPDLIVMGAGGEMLKANSKPTELLRHLGHRFVEIGSAAQVDDPGFGQGVVVGDYNEDGFPDLFFANLGRNRLLRNNGDGTFTDSTSRLGDFQANAWTTCGAIFDLNLDGLADLMTINYCRATPELENACPDDQGQPGPCHPLRFPGDTDQFFSGSPRGLFQPVHSRWQITPPPGRGLGIIAGALDGGQPSFFVANDMSRNAYYSLTDIQVPESTRMIESAAARGVSVDGRTLAQASMGIAASDFDLDGDLDLYVTGFGREYNVYYEQLEAGVWSDQTSKLDLVQPTLNFVGFGTEAVDLDSDGVDELLVTNGNIGDFGEDDSLPYEQPLQVFRRNAAGRFDLIDDDHWGRYFEAAHVGRALWTVDVNRDGRNDVAITHMSEPLRLLVNRSESDFRRVSFKLVGIRDSRDAVGAVVRFSAAGKTRTLWCLAGDGYMCSNERVLRAGVGNAAVIEDVTITWPNGSVEPVGTLATNAGYLIVQGSGEAFQYVSYRDER